jgi:hypothetical protein
MLQKHYAYIVHDLHNQMQNTSPKSSPKWSQKASYNMRTNKNGLSSLSFLSTSLQQNHCILMAHRPSLCRKRGGVEFPTYPNNLASSWAPDPLFLATNPQKSAKKSIKIR